MGWFVWDLVVIILTVLCMAIYSALKLVCRPGSLFDICISGFVGLYIPYPAFSFFQCPSPTFLGGMKDPFVRVVAILRWNFLRSVDFKVWYGWYVCICYIVMWWVWYNIPFGTFVYKCVGGCGLCFFM